MNAPADLFPETIAIAVELTQDQAWALAEFVKRVGWSDMRPLSVNGDECRAMMDAVCRVGASLAHKGFSPR